MIKELFLAKEKAFQLLTDTDNDSIMVKKAILLKLLQRIPNDLLVSFCQELETMAPTLDQLNFVEWATKMRVHLDLTQEQVAKGSGIGQEEISKFERGIINFGKKRQNKLKNFFRSKSVVGEEEVGL